jgi:hypothetical protein
MAYSVAFTPEAEEDVVRLAQQEPPLASFILDHVERLAESPTTLSTRDGYPYRPDQRYAFWGEGDHARTHVHVFFQYGQDEQTLWITAIGVVRY